MQFCLQKFEIKTHSVDCGVYKKPNCQNIYFTGHMKESLFQPWWSVRGVILTFHINWCSLSGLTFFSWLLRLDLAWTGNSSWNVQNADTQCDSRLGSLTHVGHIWVKPVVNCWQMACFTCAYLGFGKTASLVLRFSFGMQQLQLSSE